MNRIPANVQQFIYDHVDSVAYLEILLLFHSQPERKWTVPEAATELRSNENSTLSCLAALKRNKFVREDSPGVFQFAPEDEVMAQTITELAQLYLVMRHKILEMIFSPLKRARDFVDAFKRGEKKEDDNG